MRKLLYYKPLHFLCALVVAICLQFFYQIWNFGLLNLCYAFAGLLLLNCINHRKIQTIGSFILFFLIGLSVVMIHNCKNKPNYFETFVKQNSTKILKIDKVLKPNSYFDTYHAKVIQVDSFQVSGSVQVNIKKDSTLKDLLVDELIMIKADFQDLNAAVNPHQFDYKSYLLKKGIQQQVYLKTGYFASLGMGKSSLKGWSAKFRNKVQKALKNYSFSKNELGVISALLLGQRQEISKQLIADYANAGAIHILAVSGLHVGIILLILSWLLNPLERIKYGKLFKMLLIILLLWLFAFVAGLSASVVRAVTMFTFVTFGLFVKKKKVIEFSLIASLFFLLIFNPMFLFDVGFQLSYLAVFGIVWVQPQLAKIYSSTNKIQHKVWQLLTVSVAAQIGILPLSLFYFHQFPGLFFLSNLLIIPFLGAILMGGILVICLALFGILPQLLAVIYAAIISGMNGFVAFVSNQERFLFKDLSVSFSWMLVLYVFLFFGIRFFFQKTPKRLLYFLIAILLVQGVFLWESHQKKTKNEYLIFHKSRQSILAKRIGNQLFVAAHFDSLSLTNSRIIQDYKIGEGLQKINKMTFKNFLRFKQHQLLFVDSLGVYQLPSLNKPIVVLQQSPKINLERLITYLQPSQIVADGSNYKSYVANWQLISNQHQIPFHHTGTNGAFILKE